MKRLLQRRFYYKLFRFACLITFLNNNEFKVVKDNNHSAISISTSNGTDFANDETYHYQQNYKQTLF